MEEIGAYMAEKGFVLRSGGAEGADQAFERGCDRIGGEKIIYRPEDDDIPDWAFDMVDQYHPAPHRLSRSKRRLHARNARIIFDPHRVCRLVYWTEGGRVKGGTGMALRIANSHPISRFSLACPKVENACWNMVTGIMDL